MIRTNCFKSSSTYEFKRHLGVGGCAEVALFSKTAEGLPDQEVVLKIIRTSSPEVVKELINDGEKLGQLKHPHIVSTFGYERLAGDRVALVLEYIRGTNLKMVIETLTDGDRPAAAALVLSTISDALQFAHEHGIIHGDISARNILVSDLGKIKLSDFGLATKGNGSVNDKRPFKASPDYLAPEQWQGTQPTAAADIFALGILIYEILTGVNPLRGVPPRQIQNTLSDFLLKRPWATFSREWASFFDQTLSFEPEKRTAIAQLREGLSLPLNMLAQGQECLAKAVSKKMNGRCRLLESTKTMTLFVEKCVSASRKWSPGWAFTFGVLALFVLVAPIATGLDHNLQGRMHPYRLSILSQPWGEVFIDGESIGFTPLLNFKVRSGYRNLVWRGADGKSERRTLMAFENGVVTLKLGSKVPIPRRNRQLMQGW